MAWGLERILSEQTLGLHKNFLMDRRLKYSVLKKSIPELSEKSIKEILRMRIKEKEEIEDLYSDILYHEVYFSSFGREYQSSKAVKKRFRTEPSFLYELYEAVKNEKNGFLLIYVSSGCVNYTVASKNRFLKHEPVLALDLCEHAYFLDYGFDRENYLKNSLALLNLNFLDKYF